jgi:uncharacterized protein YhhL (DUF1145 family)
MSPSPRPSGTPASRTPVRRATGSAPGAGLSRGQLIFIRSLKVVVAGYWGWVLWANLSSERSSFDAIIVLSAPLLLSLHFVQGLMFVQRLKGRGPFWADFLQILVFGVLHLLPLVARLRGRPLPARPPQG